MQNNELKHYGVLGMKWGIRRARKKGTTYNYTSLTTKRLEKKSLKIMSKGDKIANKLMLATVKGKKKDAEKLSKKLGEMTKRLEKHTNKHINSAKHDKAMQDFAKKLSAGEAIAAAMLVGTTNLKYYASIKASTGDSSGLKTAASLVIANVLAGPLGARIYGQAKKSKYIKKGD